MILMHPQARVLMQILLNRLRFLEKPQEVDFQLVEFDDVRYHIQAFSKEPHFVTLSIALPPPPPETVFSSGLPFGAIEGVRATYGCMIQIVDPSEAGYNLTLKLDLTKLPEDEGDRMQVLSKICSLRAIVLGAPLREILKHLASKTMCPDADRLVSLMHRPKESCYLLPQPEKVTVVFPMRFKDTNDVILATAFLQEFMEARRTAGLKNTPPCLWSPNPPLELKGAPTHAFEANAGFVTFVIFPRHVDGGKLDRVVWSLSTFHAYVSYHIKCSKAFMHSRMRRRVETLIQVLNRAKPESQKEKKTAQGRSFKRLV